MPAARHHLRITIIATNLLHKGLAAAKEAKLPRLCTVLCAGALLEDTETNIITIRHSSMIVYRGQTSKLFAVARVTVTPT